MFVWMDMAMTKKELLARIEQLEKENAELKVLVQTLAMKLPIVVSVPAPVPVVNPPINPPLPVWPPYTPYIGDLPNTMSPTITCGTQTSNNESLWRD